MGSIGGALVTLLTGSSPDQLQAEAQAAEQQLALAIQAMIALTAVNTVLLAAITYLAWKGKSK